MKLLEILLSLLMVSAVITGMGVGISGLGAQYGRTEAFNYTVFDTTGNITATADELQAKIGSGTTNDLVAVFDVLNFLFFDLSAIFFTIPNLIHDIVSQTSNELGAFLPKWLFQLIYVSALIAIVVKVASIVFRRDV